MKMIVHLTIGLHAVNDDGFKLGLKASGFAMEINNDKEGKLLSSEDAAKYLWVRFTNHLTLLGGKK